jgi:hypothetical protein
MAIIQISKIQLRRGVAADLPGKPTSLSPITFEDALDSGEVGYATDQGRLFIGSDPSGGWPNFQRTSYPYQNIEILTENSTEVLSSMLNSIVKTPSDDAYYSSLMVPSPTDWAPVNITMNDQSDYQFRLQYGVRVAARIEYSAFAPNGDPIRIGTLFIYHKDDGSEPAVIDQVIAPDTNDSDFDVLEFAFAQVGSGSTRYLALNYKNTSSDVITLRFRVSDPRP